MLSVFRLTKLLSLCLLTCFFWQHVYGLRSSKAKSPWFTSNMVFYASKDSQDEEDKQDEPDEPDGSDEPDEPDELDKPDDSDELEEPDEPDESDELNEPDEPDELDKPDDSDELEEPDEPDESDELNEPDEPNELYKPDDSDELEEPDKPDESDELNESEESNGSDESKESDGSNNNDSNANNNKDRNSNLNDDNNVSDLVDGYVNNSSVSIGNSENHDSNPNNYTNGPRNNYIPDKRHYYVGEVSANDGESVFIGGTRFKGASPWLKVARAGMWFEAFGHWEENVFIAEEVNVLLPIEFAYYKGPAAALGNPIAHHYSFVEVWTNGNSAIESIRSAPQEDNILQLVAYFDGIQLEATPQGLPPPPSEIKHGWNKLIGRFDGDRVIWQSVHPFP